MAFSSEENVVSGSEQAFISSNSRLMISEYAAKLDGNIKSRYLEKIAVIGIDPLLIPKQKFDPECLPPVEASDLLSYLVLDTSFYTNAQFKAFRSLQAYNQMVSGFISSILGHIIKKKYVVVAKVRHSQRMKDPHVQLWIITNKEGTVVSAHCTGCMAGLGECCSHVASVLFYLEVWTKLNGKLACTQVKCTWILPTYVKQVDYAPVKNINFTSARKLKIDLDKSIEELDPTNLPGSPPVQQQRQPSIKPSAKRPSTEELKQFFSSLNEYQSKPVCLSLVQPYSTNFISKTRGIKPVRDLFDPKYLDFNYAEILKECHKVELNISNTEIRLIERETVTQAKGSAFFRHRAGRIGASKSRAACHTDPAQPSQSLIKSICYPELFKFSTAATSHGCKHEDATILQYEEEMKVIHINFRVTKCGTIINKEYPFIHATPDFLCSCDCCGSGCGEVKCPYCIEGLDFDTYVLGKTSCLEKKDSTFLLKRDHDYYFQVQQQLHTTKYTYCDFVVCAFDMKDSKLVQERILPDNAHWEIQIQKLSIFWRICILPEILGRWYTRKLHLKEDKNPVNYDGDCYCQMKTNEKTVMCSNSTCPISQFHPSCLSIDKVPKT